MTPARRLRGQLRPKLNIALYDIILNWPIPAVHCIIALSVRDKVVSRNIKQLVDDVYLLKMAVLKPARRRDFEPSPGDARE
jgi:hypothetical protein